MTHTARIPAFFTVAQAQLKSMVALSMSVKNGVLGHRLIELINLRVSQINGCGVCIDMHWRDLIKQGADPRHLNSIAGWRESPFFNERERAALGWAEAVNALPQKDDTDAAFREVKEHFNDEEIAQMGYAISVIKGWNMLNLSLRNQIPEVPPPGM
ncbi:carboxymuconolactone decarboxylase family protein [Pseudoduganella sp. UC29_106]|uniref:carboxymuconolactone decarboxylase family protein n=1 Tax=Pseudoduganella sp. UC29_106 TaxID=3374553 RepID=UPI003757AC07